MQNLTRRARVDWVGATALGAAILVLVLATVRRFSPGAISSLLLQMHLPPLAWAGLWLALAAAVLGGAPWGLMRAYNRDARIDPFSTLAGILLFCAFALVAPQAALVAGMWLVPLGAIGFFMAKARLKRNAGVPAAPQPLEREI